jgi:hypothetical protein
VGEKYLSGETRVNELFDTCCAYFQRRLPAAATIGIPDLRETSSRNRTSSRPAS